jgi:hypothetical protein
MDRKSSIDLNTVLDRLHNRREFLSLFGKGLGYSALASILPACGGSSDDPASPLPETIPKASTEYNVLKRTSFGPHRNSLASIQSLGVDVFLEQQLDYSSITDGTLETDIQTLFPLAYETPVNLYAGFPDNIYSTALDIVGATQYRQIFSQRQLYEVMVEFWSDHFNIHFSNGLGPTLKPENDLQVVRTHALGNFGDLLRAVAESPAMLFYLDNFFNIAGGANENYARELMELHTLGVDGGYTETDVKEVARCFTGWSILFPNDTGPYGTFVYHDIIHDQDSKLVLGTSIPAGGGQTDGIEVLNLLAAHASTATFIATKLCRRFITDDPDAVTVDAVASVFSTSNGDIKATLSALFATDAFLNSSDLKFTRPTEYLAGMVRALAPDTSYPSDNGQLLFFIQDTLGQMPFNWPTPDGYPDRQSYWASTGGLLNRWRVSFVSFAPIFDAVDVIDIDYELMLNGANTLASMLDALTESILMRPLSTADYNIMLDWLTGEYAIDKEFVIVDADAVEAISAIIAAALISSAYFQLR